MKVTYEHKNELTFIGFYTEIAPDEGALRKTVPDTEAVEEITL